MSRAGSPHDAASMCLVVVVVSEATDSSESVLVCIHS